MTFAQEAKNSGADAATIDALTIAVAPFINISGAAADDWIGHGIAETVSADLEQLDVLSLVRRDTLIGAVPSTSVSVEDREQQTVRRVSRQLGAAWLVSGAVPCRVRRV